MSKKYTALIWLLLSFMFFNGVFAEDLICCYNGQSILAKQSCGGDEINLGVADLSQDTFCNFPQLKCKTSSGSCTSRPTGENIFDHSLIKNRFASTCIQYFPISDVNCDSSGAISTGTSNTNSSVSGVYVGGDLNQGNLDLGFDTPDQTVLQQAQSQVIQTQCSDAGGQFGFFSSKNSCESIDGCVYNPNYGGYLSTSFAESSIHFDYDYTEKNSCVAKILIKKCSDYKTKNNCEQNTVLNYLIDKKIADTTNLELGCSWIESSTYSEGNTFSNQMGICISNITGESKFFDRKKYIDRQNLIKNPSFEKGYDSWTEFYISTEPSSNKLKTPINSEPRAWHGNSYYDLSNTHISQKILGVRKGVPLASSLYFQRREFTTEDISLQIKFYNAQNHLIETKFLSHDLLNKYNYGFGGFEKLKFEDFTIPNETTSLDFILTGSGNNIFVDAISLEVQPSGPVTQNNEFKSFDVIKSGASNCNLCYNELDLNSCTKTKSDLLGDCSYMTLDISKPYESNLSTYSGRDENNFSRNFPWESQSIANSILFCEMYLDETKCEDSSNYVNSKYSSLHVQKNGNLCKWNNVIGCYKDSNGDNLVDTIEGKPKVFGNENLYDGYASSLLTYKYAFEGNNYSDFAYGCDVIAPTGYVFFSAKNQSMGEKYIYSSDFSEIVGDMKINVDSFDFPISYMESCRGFNYNNSIIFDYKITNGVNTVSNYKSIIGSNYLGLVNVKNFFTDADGENLLVDGVNNIDFRILDRSGNVGFSKTFRFNLDISGPSFDAKYKELNVNGGEFFTSVIGKNSSFDFTIEDYSKVVSCNYNLKPLILNSIPSNYYVPAGSFNLTNITGLNNGAHQSFKYSFKLPIINTDSSFTNFNLNVTCIDIYGQETRKDYFFRADFDTNLVLISPSSYWNYSQNVGFFNNTFDLNLISTDKNITDCDLNYNDGRATVDFDVVSTGYGIISFATHFNHLSYPGEKFYLNITIPVTLQNIGLNNISFTCSDTNGNIHTENIKYYYDNLEPSFVNYSVINSIVNGRNNSIRIGNNYYVNNLTGVSLNLSIDGTQSCISNLRNLTAWNFESGLIANDGNAQNLPFSLKTLSGATIDSNVRSASHLSTKQNLERTCNFTTFVSSFVLSSFTDSNIYSGIKDSSNYDLSSMKYGFEFWDMAKNPGINNEITFYYDSKKPSFNFDSEDISTEGTMLYTDKVNPNLKIDFATPSYRTYNCKVTSKWDRRSTGVYAKSSVKNINSTGRILEFDLLALSSDINLTRYKNVLLTFECSDNYGALPLNSFTLNYDNTAPVLNELSFENNNIYLVNYASPTYNDINNNLIFDLADTSEINYVCGYKFSSSDYNCKNDQFNVSFTSRYKLLPLVLVESNDPNRPNADAMCTRKSNFNGLLEAAGDRFETTINVTAKCTDKIGHETMQKNTSAHINYMKSEMLSLDFTYSLLKAYPVVKVSNQYEKIVISYDNLGEQEIATLNYNNTVNGIYIYTLSSGIDLSSINEGTFSVYAVGFSDGSPVESIMNNLVVDKTRPQLEFNVLDTNNGVIYSSDFMLNFNAYDFNSLDKIELYMNSGSTIFRYDVRTGMFYNDSRYISGDFENWNSCMSNSCAGVINFVNGAIGTNYTLIMKVYDIYGNFNTSTVNVKVLAGVGITLQSSSSSVVSPSGNEWLTVSDSPIVSFKTSRVVDFCRVYPMVEDEWKGITSNVDIGNSNSGMLPTGTDFTLNLASGTFASNFNLSKKSDLSSNIKIDCYYNGTTYSYVRKVKKINYLPDYVLSSSEGFVLNENPYTTTLEVTSVGPYRYLDYCNYIIDGQELIFPQRTKTKFTLSQDFSSYSSGVHELNIVCQDILGNVGPTKQYNFSVGKGVSLSVNNVKLAKNSKEYNFETVLNEKVIYVPDRGPFSVKFDTNKKNGALCSYSLTSSSSTLSGFFNFIKGLFGIGYENISFSNSVYSYEKTGINLESDVSNLDIVCRTGNEVVTESLVVKVDRTEVNSVVSVS